MTKYKTWVLERVRQKYFIDSQRETVGVSDGLQEQFRIKINQDINIKGEKCVESFKEESLKKN